MITARRSSERGHVRMGWLDTRHSFSFGNYYDPRHMGWSVLRVINDDYVAGRNGFGMHGHRNMEILTVMLEGTLTHRDSMGNEAVLRAGECQMMSAGRGVMHSEMNQQDDTVHLLQIWLEPEVNDTAPTYQQKAFPAQNGLTLIASPEGQGESFRMRQQAAVWRGRFEAGATVSLPLLHGKHAWLHVIGGDIAVDGGRYGPGDAVVVADESAITLTVSSACDFIYFDLP